MVKKDESRERGQPAVKVKVIYTPGGQGLKDAYRLLAKKVLEERNKRCARQSTLG